MAHFFLLWLIFIESIFLIDNNHLSCSSRCLLLLQLLSQINLNALRLLLLLHYDNSLDVAHVGLLGILGGGSDHLIGRRGTMIADLINFAAQSLFLILSS